MKRKVNKHAKKNEKIINRKKKMFKKLKTLLTSSFSEIPAGMDEACGTFGKGVGGAG